MAIVAKNGTAGLYLGTGSPLVYAKIPGVTNWDRGTKSAEELDATDFDSPVGDREYVSGLAAYENGSFVMNYDPDNATHLALVAAVGGAALKFRTVYDNKQKNFDALVLSVADPIEVGGIMKATVTIKRTGAEVVENVT
jgi:hypothetical protein